HCCSRDCMHCPNQTTLPAQVTTKNQPTSRCAEPSTNGCCNKPNGHSDTASSPRVQWKSTSSPNPNTIARHQRDTATNHWQRSGVTKHSRNPMCTTNRRDDLNRIRLECL